MWLRSSAIVARRELAGYFYAPIAYVVGVLFLVIQGVGFASIVRVLADPTRPAPYGAVLENLFGGTLLYWAVLFLVVAVVSMRLVAEDKRSGMWESLLTTQAGVGSVLIGKWMAAVLFYVLLWAPTALYLIVLFTFLPEGASMDWGPVASAYMGVMITGVAFLAVGLAASTVTSNQIIAAVSSFTVLLALLLVGELERLPIHLRNDMARFARGDVRSSVVVVYVGLTATALALAYAGVALGRRRRNEVQGRLLASVLIGAIAVLASVIASRHPATVDVSRDRMNSLDVRTVQVLGQVNSKLEILLIRPGVDAYVPVFREVERVVNRMATEQPLLHVTRIDPALQPSRINDVAAEFAIVRDNLYKGGGVVLQLGTRRRARELLELADFGVDALKAPGMSKLRAEKSLATAVAQLIDPDRPRVCVTRGHGEFPFADSRKTGAPTWRRIVSSIRADGMRVTALRSFAAGLPHGCRLVIVFGPARPFKAVETVAIERYLKHGGALLVATRTTLPSHVAGTPPPRTGLDMVLRSFGIALRDAIVVDPARAPPGDDSLTWITSDGYGDHRITSSFRHRRTTIWRRPRVVSLRRTNHIEAAVLVSSSRTGWGETDLRTLDGDDAVTAGTDDVLGPAPVAVAARDTTTGARVVVLGAARAFSSEFDFPGYANRALVLSAVAWLTGRRWSLPIDERTPRQPRLVMTRAQVRSVFMICVGAIPLAFAGLGGLIWWRRRRE